MIRAHNPIGNLITDAEAAQIAGKHERTIRRWVDAGHIREALGEDLQWRVSEVDVRLMAGKRWTRSPRLRHVDLT